MTLQKLHLSNYRNLLDYDFEFGPRVSLIVGENGAGKTNLLEAISMLVPGKGLRNAVSDDVCAHGENHWRINAELLARDFGLAKLDIDYAKDESKKHVYFNGSKISGNELANFASVIWLTPQMDGIFTGPPKDRRKFLDRIVFSEKPSHAQTITKYENLQKERMRVLESSYADEKWLSVLEREMSELSVIIVASRTSVAEAINAAAQSIEQAFPKVRLSLTGDIVQCMNDENPVHKIASGFLDNRTKDRLSGKTNFGAQKCDIRAFYEPNGAAAEQCSTGQQKALLISIIMAQQVSSKAKPILLLDEIFVHLDEKRRAALGEFLANNNSQVFITSTEHEMSVHVKSSDVIEIRSNMRAP